MPRYVDARELRKMWDSPTYGPRRVSAELSEALETGRAGKPGGLRLEDFSIRDLFEELIPGGRDVIRAWGRGSETLLESAGAADTSAFSILVGQLMFDRLLEGYESPTFIWPQLCSPRPTTRLFGQKIPGVANLGDVGEEVGEDKPYPRVTSSAHYIDVGRLIKRGFTVPVTRELTIADNTGLVIQRLDKSSQSLGISLEKRTIDAAIGVTNNYSRDGVATNTYLTAGAYVNAIASNNLLDWKSLQNAELLFDALSDPDTGEPIIVNPNTLLVPTALKADARRIVSASEIETVDNQANSVTVRTRSSNPASGNYTVLSSPYVKRRSSSAARWWLGDFKKMLGRYTAWDIEKDQRGRESPLNFTHDTVMEFKGSVMDLIQVEEPRVAVQSS